jgi:hypothetical protein
LYAAAICLIVRHSSRPAELTEVGSGPGYWQQAVLLCTLPFWLCHNLASLLLTLLLLLLLCLLLRSGVHIYSQGCDAAVAAGAGRPAAGQHQLTSEADQQPGQEQAAQEERLLRLLVKQQQQLADSAAAAAAVTMLVMACAFSCSSIFCCKCGCTQAIKQLCCMQQQQQEHSWKAAAAASAQYGLC